MKLFLLLGLVAAASAACPNACSGHGTCGEHDMCTCYRNWMAADCSERVCQYDWSFVTTPQGDLNMNGNIYDSMLYRATHYDDGNVISASQEKTNLFTQRAPGGTWEMWPSFAASGTDEGHFYMECSNRGVCDRKSGECECFDGYEGAACRRTVCPNACSGHGTCQSVKDQTSTYNLWDADKSMSCVCDAGYASADCSERKCPVGDDPLTTGQRNENMYIDVNGGTSAIAGYIQLKYVDDFGETWWTDYIQVDNYEATATTTNGNAATSASAQAAAVKAALEGIPNGVFESVEVTAWKLIDVLAGTHTTTAATTYDSGIDTADLTDIFTDGDSIVTGASKTTVGVYASHDGSTITFDANAAEHTGAVFYRQRENGIRFQVNFTKNTGDLTDLSCLVADRFSNTEQRILAAGQTCSVNAGVDFTAGTTIAVSSGVLTSNFDLSVDSKDTGAITNDWDNNAVDASTQTQLHAGDRVASGANTATLTSNFYFNKATHTLTLSAAASVSAGELVSQSDARGVVKASSTGTSVSVLVVSGTFTDAAVHFSKAGKATASAAAEDTAADATGWALVAGGDFTAAQGAWKADGTTEKAECSNRGLCDTSTGVCACFKGYTDDNCSRQSVLAA